MQQRLLGIVGGMGPQAGVALHEAIIRHTPADKDQDHLSVALMTCPGDINDRTAFLEGETATNPATGIIPVVEQLACLGTEVIGMPCNTSHAPKIYEPVSEYIRNHHPHIQLVHLPDETIKQLGKCFPEHKKVGLMTTNGTFRSGIYQLPLQRHGYEVVEPDWDFQDQVIHKMIYDKTFGIKANSVDITSEAKQLWNKALGYFRSRGVDSIILGCTELSLIQKECPEYYIKLIDTTEILAIAMISEAFKPRAIERHPTTKTILKHNPIEKTQYRYELI